MLSALISSYLVLFAYLTYRSPRLALATLVAVLPSYLIRFTVFGVPATLLEVTIWTFAFIWFLTAYRQRGGFRLLKPAQAVSKNNPFHPYFFPILLWLTVATVAAVVSPNPVAALGVWKAYFVEPLLIFSIAIVEFVEAKERRWLVYGLGVAALAIALGAWFQKITGLFIPEPYASALPLKVTSFFAYPNAVGLFLAPVIALYATWAFYNARNSLRLLWQAIVVIFGIGAIVFSMTKGAWIGVVTGILFGAFFALRGRHRIALFAVGVIALLAVLVLPVTRQTIIEQATLHSPSGKMRVAVWQETMAMLTAHPVVGAGLAGYQIAVAPYHQDWRPEVTPYKIEIFLYPHNAFLNVWAELGIAGLLVFFWLLFAFFRLAWDRRGQALSVAAMAAMVALLVHGLVDVPYFKNDLAFLFWILMAISLLESLRVHVLHVGEDSFSAISRGARQVEARLLDRRHRAINVGDILLCYPHENSYECVRAEVVELTPKETFSELLATYHPAELGFETEAHGLATLRQRYSEEDEQYLGVVGIRLRVVR
ncbi:hypothetical protein COV04_03270 [Candidatus Uhrbacteria bacterium CG10_big_fil_rev_8_21_14_0_10_48_11]|uniref:ASCH domain-containing protein n=1 Tax=Candidatus Uhrbacteria bacterium CG10_big_fil_rev_8_21_14_0_10_48_11 TaxID=1975037 RepID=A0A2M8LEE9_9BACT|nr:MAG: hypothetical protein COV04_03270 [Candidatus Uhrbacteria bacterium CG10_big_fil_rev_8_21_14_0_10_48_11]